MHGIGVGRINVDRVGPSAWIVELDGEHDLSTAASLQDELAAIFALGTTVLIDLTAVTFIDSSILAQLILAQRRVDHDDAEHLALVAPAGGAAARLVDLVGVGGLFTIFQTRSDALRALAD
jgi:anti-anti-sigma factor